MELERFVRETVQAIIKGVRAAQEANADTGAQINPADATFRKDQGMRLVSKSDGTLIEELAFDVAVVASDESEREGSAGIRVYGVGAGGSGSSMQSNTSESRIRFCVPLRLPTHPGTTRPQPARNSVADIQAAKRRQ